MRIDIWSDVVCPWCYLGAHRFQRALEAFPHRDRIRIAHRSFQLDPGRPLRETSRRRTMLMEKYGLSEAQVEAMDAKMEETAAQEGLEYHLTDAGLTGNTLDAHQLVHLATTHGLEPVVLERFYRAYFTEQRSLFDRDVLVELATEAGLDPHEAREALEHNRYADAVARDVKDARALGISGVPFFVFDGRYGVSGAQTPDVFSLALERAWSARGTES